MNPINEWNTLKIVAKGETIWLFLNGEYVGVAHHPGNSSGGIGMSIDVERDTEDAFAFRNLVVRQLGWLQAVEIPNTCPVNWITIQRRLSV